MDCEQLIQFVLDISTGCRLAVSLARELSCGAKGAASRLILSCMIYGNSFRMYSLLYSAGIVY